MEKILKVSNVNYSYPSCGGYQATYNAVTGSLRITHYSNRTGDHTGDQYNITCKIGLNPTDITAIIDNIDHMDYLWSYNHQRTSTGALVR